MINNVTGNRFVAPFPDEVGKAVQYGKTLKAHGVYMTHFFAHKKRRNAATDTEGILSAFKGVLCHDHWKPYYCYRDCLHALCNAHHLRELTRSWEQDGQKWSQV